MTTKSAELATPADLTVPQARAKHLLLSADDDAVEKLPARRR